MSDNTKQPFKQLEFDWPKSEREYYLKEVVFPKGLKIDHAKLAAVMNRIASFHGQPDGCYESVATLMKLCKLSEDQVERSFAALRKLNLLLERDRPEWHKGSFRKIHPRWINFDELKLMVQRQTNPARQAYEPRTGTVGTRTARRRTPHGKPRNPAPRCGLIILMLKKLHLITNGTRWRSLSMNLELRSFERLHGQRVNVVALPSTAWT